MFNGRFTCFGAFTHTDGDFNCYIVLKLEFMPMLVKGKMSIAQQEVMMLITYSSLIRNICARIFTFNEQKKITKKFDAYKQMRKEIRGATVLHLFKTLLC